MSTNFAVLVEALENQGFSRGLAVRLANQTDSACTEYADKEEIQIIAQGIAEDIRALEEALSAE